MLDTCWILKRTVSTETLVTFTDFLPPLLRLAFTRALPFSLQPNPFLLDWTLTLLFFLPTLLCASSLCFSLSVFLYIHVKHNRRDSPYHAAIKSNRVPFLKRKRSLYLSYTFQLQSSFQPSYFAGPSLVPRASHALMLLLH